MLYTLVFVCCCVWG